MGIVSLDDIRRASDLLEGKIIRTPLVYSPTFSRMSGAEVYLKLENLQKGGSFKLRGATYKIQSRRDEIGPMGVVAASAGNHAQGVAMAAKAAGIPATIVMPEWASIGKQEATKGYGAEVILQGKSLEDSILYALELAKDGMSFIHPYDDLDIITGQATIGLEILEDIHDPDVIFVPIGGGGLVSGIATAAKAIRPETRIIGVQAANCPSAYQARQKGSVTRVKALKSIADGIAVRQIGEITFQIIQEMVERIVLVEEELIVEAVSLLLERKKVLSEGAGAVTVAALLGSKVDLPVGSVVVLVISGGNVDSPLLERIIRHGLLRNGRVMHFSAWIEDVPGSLTRLLGHVAKMEGNVLQVRHARWEKNLPINVTRVDIEVEIRGFDHIEAIAGDLRKAGYQIRVA